MVKEFVSGVNVAGKSREEVLRGEAKLEHLKRTHARNMAALQKSAAKLESTVAERAAEIKRLQARQGALGESVSAREAIVQSRRGDLSRGYSPDATSRASRQSRQGGSMGSGTGRGTAEVPAPAAAQAAGSRHGGPGAYLHKAQLGYKAKQQAAELKALRVELAKLQARSFPTFEGSGAVAAGGQGWEALSTKDPH